MQPSPLGARARRRRALNRARRKRHQRLLAALLLVLIIGAAALAVYLSAAKTARASSVALMSGDDRVARLSAARAERVGKGKDRLPIPSTRVATQGSARITYHVDADELRQRLLALGGSGGRVGVPERPIESEIRAPIFEQAFRNNCETAALSMLLATTGVEVDQRALQDQIARADPLDPESGTGGQMVWGDPNLGFVGRVDGGGPAGGYGVYDRPIANLARKWATPVDLSGQSPRAIYDRLLAGHAVMVWIGLSDGPYETWRTPQGKQVKANFGEHTVLLTGVEGDRVLVNDPLDGRRKRWSKSEFVAMWQRLGRRAVSL